MSHPPYHLRVNKAVDRLALIEAIRLLEKLCDGDLSAYTYYGLGGPFLEDFRLLYELYPRLAMASLEEKREIYKRQRFHLPCGTLRLYHTDVRSFLKRHRVQQRKSIFWLDFTGLRYGHIDDFMTLLEWVDADSMIKITLQAEPKRYPKTPESADQFHRQFGAVLPEAPAELPGMIDGFALLLQGMLRVASQKALPSGVPLMFQPISSFCYSDGTGMFTLTGVVCAREEDARVRSAFKDWRFANLDWGPPTWIDMPVLSTKERLHLQCLLPCGGDPGPALRNALGYLTDDDLELTEAGLRQYAHFHRYHPYFVRAMP